MRPRGCLRPSPPSTECRGGRCACAAWRLRRGRYYLSNAADAGFARRPPPFGRYMTGAARFPSGMRPDASGGRLGRPASAGQPSTGARGVVPLPPCICRRGRRTSAYVFLFEGCCAGRVFYICLVFGLLVSLQAASPCHFPEKRWPHSLPAVVLPLRNVGTELCINYCTSVQFWLHTRALPAQTQVCSQQLRAQTTTRRHSAPSKQKCPTF